MSWVQVLCLATTIIVAAVNAVVVGWRGVVVVVFSWLAGWAFAEARELFRARRALLREGGAE